MKKIIRCRTYAWGLHLFFGLSLILLLSLLEGGGGPPPAVAQAPAGQKVLVDAEEKETLQQLAAGGATLLADYGTFSLWQVTAAQSGQVRSPASLQPQPEFDQIPLRGGQVIETGAGKAVEPRLPDRLRQKPGQAEELWMIQFVGPIKPEWLAALTAETFSPPNEAPDPSEQVTVNFTLQNIGSANTTNLVATLLPGGGVTAPDSPQSYGALTVGGPGVSRPFAFAVNPALACGSTLTATLQLQDGAINLGTIDHSFTLGTVNLLATHSFTSPARITLPHEGNAVPFPSMLPVSGMPGSITQVTATLTRLNHAFYKDVDVLLVGPQAQTLILMSDAGSFGSGSPVTLTFADTAATLLPEFTSVVSGTFRPTNYEGEDSFLVPAPYGPYGTALSAFKGSDPNGTWRLFMRDDTTGQAGVLGGGWGLTISTGGPFCAAAPGDLYLPVLSK